tara:strand:- start:14751 stop:16235 length:1485 start_codon:yes stop_codon:yes gene_type:complete
MQSPFKQIPTLAVWEPIHPDDWGPEEARHFLERVGFAATPEYLEEATDLGATGCCDRFFPEVPFTEPEWITNKSAEITVLRKEARQEKDREERRKINRKRDQVRREAVMELEHEWLLRASNPEAAFRAKWELFLSDVWVVGKRTVREPEQLGSYWATLANQSDVSYPDFCKAFSREPAMVRYLDLNRSSKKKPNENFARELMELFTLGEGNYSEIDIKQAARAFTGRRLNDNEYRFVERYYDDGYKTVFSRNGRWTGDQVIDIIFLQPASRTYLPSEAIRFYLTNQPIPDERMQLLGDLWAEENFQLDALRRRLFSSRGFYAQDFRGTRIKSPLEFYLGTLQRFGIQPPPLPQRTTRNLRDMGQELFEPPNVRGWVGNEAWINAGKLAARRQTADMIFEPIPMKKLNADDRYRVERDEARPNARPFYVNQELLLEQTGTTPDEVIDFVANYLLSIPPSPEFIEQVSAYLESNPSPEKIETLVLSVIQSPQYQIN